MLKTKVGYSENNDSYASGMETSRKAEFKKAQVVLLFTSVVQNQKQIIAGFKSVNPRGHVIGCTSSAAICTQDGYLNKDTGYSGMMSFGGKLKVGVAGAAKDGDAREMGRKLAHEAMKSARMKKAPDYFFMVCSPAEEEFYLKGIEDVIGRVPVFGGSAADNTVEGKWSVFCDDKVFADGCAIAFFYTDGYMKNLYDGAYTETTNSGIITKIKGNRTLVEIDGVPAGKKYAEWTGKNLDAIKGGNLLAASVFAPLAVKDPIGSITAIRHPMFLNDDLSRNIGANLAINTAVIQMSATPASMIKANPDTITKLNSLMTEEAQSYFLVHCGGRRLGLALQGVENKIYPAVKEVTGDKEFLMVFTFGEYGMGDNSANTVGGLSLSYTGFGK